MLGLQIKNKKIRILIVAICLALISMGLLIITNQ